MPEYHLRTAQSLAAPLDKVFGFFADAANLQAITPPYLNFRILTPLPVDMREGALIDYALSLHGIPFRWRTEITAWEPGRRFIDQQLKGPYAQWIHEHTFAPDPANPGHTLVTDHVRYRLHGGPLAAPVHALFVRPRLDAIFAYRAQATKRLIEQR